VQLTGKMVRNQGFEADGLIKVIFAAPEYLISKEREGLYKAGKKWMRGIRPLSEDTHNNILQELIALSKRFPRILIIPRHDF
jgi:hypothetical protein